MPPSGWTINEALVFLDPPIPRRTLAELLMTTEPIGRRYGGRGPRAAVYSIRDVVLAHAGWVRRNCP